MRVKIAGGEVIIDEEDAWLLEEYKWHVNEGGYARTSSEHMRCYLHHAIVGCPIWHGEQVDHINRIRLDDRRSNLRIVTMEEQRLNSAIVLNATNITMNKGYYQVQIVRNGKRYTSYHKTMEEAIADRDRYLATQRPPRPQSLNEEGYR